jgi:hypothetical protein
LSNPDAYATTLLIILLDQFGIEALDWAPETIRLELRDDFQVDLPQVNVDKIMAAISIVTSDDFYKNLPKFIQLCNVLADDEFNPGIFDPADSAEMSWAITEALLLSPPEEEEPFTDEIRFYIGHMLNEEGLVNPPDVLRIALYDTPVADPLSLNADDPVMYGALYQSQQAKSKEITDMLQRQLRELFEQIQMLSLRNGDNQELLKRIQGSAIAED